MTFTVHFSFKFTNTFIAMSDSNSGNGAPESQSTYDGSESTLNNKGTSFRERMRYLRAQERANIKPLHSVSASGTPSSAGDIDPSAPPEIPETVSPLAVRHDKELPHHENSNPTEETPVPFVAPQALHYETPQPIEDTTVLPESDLGLANRSDVVDNPPGTETQPEVDQSTLVSDESPHERRRGVLLGPYEFAVPLSMDSRVKDDYDKTLARESRAIAKYVEESSSVEDSDALDVNLPKLDFPLAKSFYN